MPGAAQPSFSRHDSDVDDLRRLVHDDLQLPYKWLPRLLLMDFAARFLSDVGSVPLSVLVSPPNPPDVAADVPRGRQPKSGGDYIDRDVGWYYRAELKQTPDTVYAIAKEQRRGTKRGRRALRDPDRDRADQKPAGVVV